VFVPPGRDFLAVEPVTHMTDAFNRAARGERDTGTRWLGPGDARSCTMRIVVTAHDSPNEASRNR
jgi:aldose 1-epimerase